MPSKGQAANRGIPIHGTLLKDELKARKISQFKMDLACDFGSGKRTHNAIRLNRTPLATLQKILAKMDELAPAGFEPVANREQEFIDHESAYPETDSDPYQSGIEPVFSELVVKARDPADVYRLTTSAEHVDAATRSFLLGYGDFFCSSLSPEESIEFAIGEMPWDWEAIRQWMKDMIAFHADSMWFYHHPKDRNKNLLASILPLCDESYGRLLAGEATDWDIAKGPPCKQSNRLLLNMVCGHARYGRVEKLKAVVKQMIMAWRQIALLTPPADEPQASVRIISFNSCEYVLRALQNLGFRPFPGAPQFKTFGYPLHYVDISTSDIEAPLGVKKLWHLLCQYQAARKTFARH